MRVRVKVRVRVRVRVRRPGDEYVGLTHGRSTVDEHRDLLVRLVVEQIEKELGDSQLVLIVRGTLLVDHAAHLGQDARAVSRTAGVHPRERGKPRTDAGRTVPERKVRCTPRKVISEHRGSKSDVAITRSEEPLARGCRDRRKLGCERARPAWHASTLFSSCRHSARPRVKTADDTRRTGF